MILVVGAGYWGTAITLGLCAAGHEVVCLDCGEPGYASRVAGGLVYPESRLGERAPAWWTARHTAASRTYLHEAGLREYGEDVHSRYRPQPRFRPGLGLVDDARLPAPRRARVERLEAGWTVSTTAGPWSAECVVLAAGVGTDRLLERAGLPPLGVMAVPGRALLVEGPPLLRPLSLAYRLAGDTRTRKCTARNWSAGRNRVGDTVGGEDGEQWEVLAAFAGPGETLSGQRPALPRLHVEIQAEGLIVATGANRDGLLTAGGAALRVLELVRSRV